MRKISFWLVILIFTVSLARAQDAATQQQIDKLYGQIQDMQAAQELQAKRLSALEKQISDLTDKVNSPAASTGASAEDLKALATQVQEIDRKRQDDRELILKQIGNLATAAGGSPPSHKSKPAPDTTAAGGDNSATPATPQKGYDYTIAAGDTLSAIAKAYHAQGVKVTASQILKANPKLDPAKLYVGQKIFIPDPNAK
ncbi:MAG TPA: LysM peptidoglycan-binding domain-containing protein [Verrucomicrobiae bacterium]